MSEYSIYKEIHDTQYTFILFKHSIMTYCLQFTIQHNVCYINKLDTTGHSRKDRVKDFVITILLKYAYKCKLIYCFSIANQVYVYNNSNKKCLTNTQLKEFWISIFKSVGRYVGDTASEDANDENNNVSQDSKNVSVCVDVKTNNKSIRNGAIVINNGEIVKSVEEIVTRNGEICTRDEDIPVVGGMANKHRAHSTVHVLDCHSNVLSNAFCTVEGIPEYDDDPITNIIQNIKCHTLDELYSILCCRSDFMKGAYVFLQNNCNEIIEDSEHPVTLKETTCAYVPNLLEYLSSFILCDDSSIEKESKIFINKYNLILEEFYMNAYSTSRKVVHEISHTIVGKRKR